MRILFVGLVVAVTIYALTITYFSLAPVHYANLDRFDADWEDVTGGGKTTQQAMSAIFRYGYWTSYLFLVGGLLLWLFLAAHQRDPQSYEAYRY